MTERRKRLRALEARFQSIAKRLDPATLGGHTDDLLDEDIFEQLTDKQEHRLLGYYSESGLLAAYEAYGLLDDLRARGYSDFKVKFTLEEMAHRLQVYGDDLQICDLKIRRVVGADDPCIAEYQRRFTLELLYIEWLELEDHRGRFTEERPPLPGQTTPGSGLSEEVFLMLTISAKRLGMDGILEIPQRFHNAAFYGHRAHFIDPQMEGRCLAVKELLNHHSLGEVAWAMEEGRIRDRRTGEIIDWPPREQLVPLSPALKRYFETSAWRQTVSRTRRALKPYILPPAA